MEYTSPTFTTGYAKNAGESLYPQLWAGLIAHYAPFMGNQSTKLYDFSGFRNHGTLTNITPSTAYVGGKDGLALAFNGSSGYVQIPNTALVNFGAGNFSLGLKCFLTTVSGTIALFTQWGGGGSNGAFYLDLEGGVFKLHYSTNGAGEVTLSSGFTVSANTWIDLWAVRQGPTVFFYVNGVQVGSASIGTATLFSSTRNIDISSYADGTGQWFAGNLSRASIYNRALTQPEIALMYNGASPLHESKITAPLVNGDITVPVSTIAVATAVIAPAVVIDCTVVASTLSVATAVVPPTSASVTVTVTPSTLSVASAVIAPAITSSPTVTPSTLTVASSVIAPIVPQSITVTPAVLNVSTSVIAPAFVGESTTFAQYASSMLSFNPLVLVTNTSPARIVRVDVTDPTNPTWLVTDLVGTTGATDVAYNSVLGKIYVACAGGKVVEVDASNFATQTVIDMGITNDFTTIALIPDFLTIFAGSNYSLGEIVSDDESTAQLVPMDIRWSQTARQTMNTRINTVNGAKLNTDIRWSETSHSNIGMDIRFNAEPYGRISDNPIVRTDFHVYLDGVELTDVKLESIQIYHAEDEKSRATFILGRRHDKLNYKVDGTFSQITNKNHVVITILGHTEFDGYIWNVDTKSETETVQVSAYTTLQKPDDRTTVTLSIPGVNEQLHVYHALIHNPTIDNPYILPDDLNPPFYTGIQVDMGYDVTQNISRGQFFGDVGALAENVSTGGGFQPTQNYTYFWFASANNFITGDQWGSLRYIGNSPTALTSNTWQVNGLSYFTQRQFPDSKLRLGDGRVYVDDFKYVSLAPAQAIYDELFAQGYIDGSGNITQKFKNTDQGFINRLKLDNLIINNETGLLDNFNQLVPGTYDYILEPFNIGDQTSRISNSSLRNNVWDIVNSKLGYFVGTAPYKKVSVKSGRFTTKDRWIDNPDGLYRQRDEGNDLRDYAKKVAALELKKMNNINGQILPKTSAEVEVFIDGYYYHQISLLKRINIDNTTEVGIYNGNNGFPVSVKSIEIDAGSMKVTMRCDNQWSRQELLEIEATYPNPEDILYTFPSQLAFSYAKFDPNKQQYIQ